MDRKSIPLIILCVLLIFFQEPILNLIFGPPKKTNPVPAVTSQGGAVTNGTGSVSTQGVATTPVTQASHLSHDDYFGAIPVSDSLTVSPVTLENEEVRIDFSEEGGAIKRIELKKYKEDGLPVMLNLGSSLPILATHVADLNFLAPAEITSLGNQQVRSVVRSPSGLELERVYTLKESYQVEVHATLKNNGSTPLAHTALDVALGMAHPVNTLDQHALHLSVAYHADKTRFEKWGGVKKEMEKQDQIYSRTGSFEWAAWKDQYFAVLLTPKNPLTAIYSEYRDLPPKKEEEGKSKVVLPGLLTSLQTLPFDLAPGATFEWSGVLFAGPKYQQLLTELGPTQEDVLDFGWATLFSKALLWSMNLIHSVTGNWGWSIVCVTLLLKTIFWPLSAISTRSMKQMQALSPKIKEIQEKYKDQPQKLNEQTMKLYREYKVNPMAGCLPMLVQFPIFIGFYYMLSSAVELRGAPFILWVHDLSMPDTVGHLFGLPINPLPLIMASTQIWQTRITPQSPNADPSMKMIMWIMPGVFLFICYSFASGLALYWTVQNLLTVAQTYYTKDKPVEPPQKVKRPPKGMTFARPLAESTKR